METALDDSKYCQRCKLKAEEKYQAYTRLYEKERQVFDAQYRQFYNSKEWKQTRLDFIRGKKNLSGQWETEPHVFCSACNKAFATEVHHVVPLKADWSKRLDKANLLGWCKPCHSRHELQERNKSKQ